MHCKPGLTLAQIERTKQRLDELNIDVACALDEPSLAPYLSCYGFDRLVNILDCHFSMGWVPINEK